MLRTLADLSRTIGRYWPRYVLGFASLLGTNGLQVATTFVVRWSVDEIHGTPDVDAGRRAVAGLAAAIEAPILWTLAALFVLAVLGQGTLRYVWRWGIMMSSHRVARGLRLDLVDRLLALDHSYFDRKPTGELLSVATADVEAIRMFLGLGLLLFVDAFVYFACLPPVLFAIDVPLTLLLLVPLPAVPFLTHRLGQAIHHRFERCQEQVARMAGRTQEGMAGIRVVKTFGRSEGEVADFEALAAESRDRFVHLAGVQALFQPLLAFVVSIEIALALWFGGQAVLAGRIAPGEFFQVLMIAMMLTFPMRELGWTLSLLQRGAASLDRLRRVLETEPAVVGGPRPADDLTGAIEFRRLSFSYPGTPEPVLSGIDLVVPAGSTLGIVGPVGSGKSALVDLVAHFYPAPPGSVLLDGTDVGRFRLADLRRAIGFVRQDPYLFSATLAENIALGRPDADRGQIERAAWLAGLADDLDLFGDGFETLLGERGINLSGGQRQRVALARALLIDPTILILDDALSQVDAGTEERILERLAPVLADRTCLVVAHRLSTVRTADRIVVLEAGRIVESGRHDELTAAGGWYARTFAQQQAGQDDR